MITAGTPVQRGKTYKNLTGNLNHRMDPNEDLFQIGLTILCLVHLKESKCYLNYLGIPKLDAIQSDITENWP
jgi:hypothetical protein